jgi:hypothetical protein
MQTLIGPVPKPTFFYRVSESVLAFDENHKLVKSFYHDEDFMDGDLFKAREAAVDYYNSHALNGPQGDFIYPFVSPSGYRAGVPFAAWSLSISIVEYYGKDCVLTMEYPIAGEREDDCKEGLELEQEVLQGLR